MQTYRLVAADVGFTIRVSESASDAAGAVTPSVSAPTAVVRAPAAGEQGGHGGAPPVTCCEKPVHVGPDEIRTLLARQLAPSGRAVSIAALLERGGLRMSFMFPKAGTLTVKWYLLSATAKLAGKKGDKPTLVAMGRASLRAAQTVRVRIALTAQGRKLLVHARKIQLEASGVFAAGGEAAVSAARTFSLKR
jgi:hypothetical protein